MLPISTDMPGKNRICPTCACEVSSDICVKDKVKTFFVDSVAGKFVKLRAEYGSPGTSELLKSSKFGYDLRTNMDGITDKRAFDLDIQTYIRALSEVVKPKVLVFSKDHRDSGDLLQAAFETFAKESGLEYGVVYGHIPTTPSFFVAASIAYQTKKSVLSLQATASHNPPNYNGIKAMGGSYTHNIYPKHVEFSSQMKSEDVIDAYLDWCTRFKPYEKEITFDMNNGAGATIIPKIASKLYPKASLFNDKLLADFGGKTPEPGWFVGWTGLGVAYDGDADRAPFYNDSKMIFFSQFLAGMIKEDLVGERKVIADQRTPPSLIDYLTDQGVKISVGDIGRTNQAEISKKNNAFWYEENWHTGGYPVGKTRFFWDDAIYATCFWLDKLNVPIEKLLEGVPTFEYTEEKFIVGAGFNLNILNTLDSKAIDYVKLPSGGVRVEDSKGHILLRESNTEIGTVKLLATGVDKDALKTKLEFGRELITSIKGK
ncbi:MAG: hypothetical protein GOU98_02835 [Candidatus Altiarchaeota archaeon]|nr:hypothetical protein [Candidatus Altiarchaeota archaeon]